MNDKDNRCKNVAITTSKLSTGQDRREESQPISQEDKETYPRQAIRDSLQRSESYCQRNDTGISQRLKQSSSMYWKQQNSKTKTRERSKRQARSTTRSKISRETWTKEEKKCKEKRWRYSNGRTISYGTKERFRYQTMKGYKPLLSLKITNPHKREMAERQKQLNSSADDIVGQR